MKRQTLRALQHEVGATIRTMREQRGLTQLQLAEKIGTSDPTISRLECGRSNMTLGTLTSIAVALECVIRLSLTPERTEK